MINKSEVKNLKIVGYVGTNFVFFNIETNEITIHATNIVIKGANNYEEAVNLCKTLKKFKLY